MGLPYEGLVSEETPLLIDSWDYLEDYPDIPALSGISLVGWWDFTDKTTLWKKAFGTYRPDYFSADPVHPSQGTVNIPLGTSTSHDVVNDDDIIGRVDNKAYWLQDHNTNALGAFLRGNTSRGQYYKTGGQNGHSYLRLGGLGHLTCGLGGLGNSGEGPQSKSEPLHGYYAHRPPYGDHTGWGISQKYSNQGFSESLYANRTTMFFVVKAGATPSAGKGKRVISLIADGNGTNMNDVSSMHFEYWSPADGSDPYYRWRGNNNLDCNQNGGWSVDDDGDHYYVNSGITGVDTNIGLWTLVLQGQGDSMLYKNGDTSNGSLTESSSNTTTGNGWGLWWGQDTPMGEGHSKLSRIIVGNRYMHRNEGSDGIPTQNNNSSCTTCEDFMCDEGLNWGYGYPDPTSSDQIYEILIYRDNLDESQRTLVETYLKNKYNL